MDNQQESCCTPMQQLFKNEILIGFYFVTTISFVSKITPSISSV